MSVKSIVRSFLETKELFGVQSRYMQVDGIAVYYVGNAVLIRKVDN